jgi:hypothetical protein
MYLGQSRAEVLLYLNYSAIDSDEWRRSQHGGLSLVAV